MSKFKALIYNFCGTLTVVWFVVIFILCATPGRYIPSADWLELLSVDKLVHASVFFILAFLSFLTTMRYNGDNAIRRLLYFFLCIIYGASLEWMQANVFSERSADWLDIIANTAGSTFALLFFRKLKFFFAQLPAHKH